MTIDKNKSWYRFVTFLMILVTLLASAVFGTGFVVMGYVASMVTDVKWIMQFQPWISTVAMLFFLAMLVSIAVGAVEILMRIFVKTPK